MGEDTFDFMGRTATYGLWHILFLVACVAMITIPLIFLRKGKHTKIVLYVCMALAVLYTILCVFLYIRPHPTPLLPGMEGKPVDDSWTIDPAELPLHLCNIQVFTIILIVVLKKESTKQNIVAFFIPTSIAGAALALFIPTTPTQYGWDNFRAFQYIVYHAMLIFLGIYLYMTYFKKLNLKNVLFSFVSLLVLSVFSIYLNSIIGHGANYFFTARPPMPNMPFLTLKYGWGIYSLALFSLVCVLIPAVFSPVIIREVKRIVRSKKG